VATTLSTEEMKAIVRQHFEDFVNNKKAEAIYKNMTRDFYDGPANKPTGVQGNEEMMRRMYKLTPDLRVTIDEMIAEGDKVVCRSRWHGTNSQT
jgi:predicted ester cyclase